MMAQQGERGVIPPPFVFCITAHCGVKIKVYGCIWNWIEMHPNE